MPPSVDIQALLTHDDLSILRISFREGWHSTRSYPCVVDGVHDELAIEMHCVFNRDRQLTIMGNASFDKAPSRSYTLSWQISLTGADGNSLQMVSSAPGSSTPLVTARSVHIRGIDLILTFHGSLSLRKAPSPACSDSDEAEMSGLILAMLGHGNVADVVFWVGDRKVYASSAVLKRRSEVWKAAFSDEWYPGDQVKYEGLEPGIKFVHHVDDYSWDVFQAAMIWVHTGLVAFVNLAATTRAKPDPLQPPDAMHDDDDDLHLTPVDPFSLYKLAAFYDLDPLRRMCLDHLKSQLDISTIARYAFSDDMKMYDDVRESLWDLILERWSEFEASPGWQQALSQQAIIHDPSLVLKLLSLRAESCRLAREANTTDGPPRGLSECLNIAPIYN